MISSLVFQQMSMKAGDLRGFQMEWAVPSDMPYLQGHFPGRPVFPAVAIVDASLYALRLKFPEAVLKSVETAKFLKLIEPGQPLQIEFVLQDDEAWRVEWKDEKGETLFATLRLRLGTKGAVT